MTDILICGHTYAVRISQGRNRVRFLHPNNYAKVVTMLSGKLAQGVAHQIETEQTAMGVDLIAQEWIAKSRQNGAT